MPSPLVTVFTAHTQFAVMLVKSRLEAEGIPVQVWQEGVATAYGFGVGPLVKADVLVPENDAEAARAIVAELNAIDPPAPEDEDEVDNNLAP